MKITQWENEEEEREGEGRETDEKEVKTMYGRQ